MDNTKKQHESSTAAAAAAGSSSRKSKEKKQQTTHGKETVPTTPKIVINEEPIRKLWEKNPDLVEGLKKFPDDIDDEQQQKQQPSRVDYRGLGATSPPEEPSIHGINFLENLTGDCEGNI
ncbi:hypothetical protein BVC80_1831g227 [Macleaya cordata]|uniref:Uncharacterized protein n=1 Tax=Macleaya cordata TaxID=56857 RepID=A0A200R7H4_MACCD|nr:hypothetical protein BVC80_1831g227 [Macleaya cordata]